MFFEKGLMFINFSDFLLLKSNLQIFININYSYIILTIVKQMKAVMPQEIEVWYILPALRREFSKILIGKGLSQRAVAKKLYLTEAAVSQYMNGKRGNDLEFDNNMRKEIENSVENFLKTGNLVGEFQELCRKIRQSRLLCSIHEKFGILPEECKLNSGEVICMGKGT